MKASLIGVLTRSMLLLCALLANASLAAEQVTDAVGYGQSPKQAITDALIQGVRQVTGVQIDSREVTQSISARRSVSDNDGNQSVDAFSVSRTGDLNIKTRGLISRYDVNSTEQQDDGSYRADVTVYIAKYEKPGLPADSRRTLAIMPLHSDKRAFYLLGDKTAAAKIEAEIRNRLIDEFTQSRKVNVLDREFGAEYQAEKSLWLSDDAATGEAAKTANVLGADYIIVGNIRNISSRKHVETIQLTGETLVSYSGKAQLDYKIILAATRQIKWSDTLTFKFSNKQIKQMLRSFGSSQAGITNQLAQSLAQEALANIYPLRVVGVKGKTVVINQGGKTLKKGDLLDVFLLGDEMFDPYTNESLGQLEEKIAQVKVIRSTAKLTYAKVVDGDAELIEPSYIVRR